MAINWKYIKGMTNSCTSWIEFSNETYSESTDTTNYAPEIKYYNTDNYGSAKPLGKIITSDATGQVISKDFKINGKLSCNNDLTCKGNINIYQIDGNQIRFYNNNTQLMSITNNSEYFSLNANKLFINSDMWIEKSELTNNKTTIISGNTKINSTSVEAPYFNAVSDKRAKENIIPFKGDALKIINSLQTYTFNYKNNPTTSYGILAQDLVDTKINDFSFIDNIAATGIDDDYMKVKESKLVYLLLEGLKAQQKEIEELKLQLEELKNGK